MSQTASSDVTAQSPVVQPESNSAASPDLVRVYAPVADGLAEVEQLLRQELRSDTPFVDQLLEHSWLLGGKRIRPLLLLLTGASQGKLGQPHVQMAAALEMIHTATLVHDDIIDDAETRRHRPTANAVWGIRQSILLGDYLFTHAFHLASKADHPLALQFLALASNRVCEGEMRQNAWQGNFDLDETSYLKMIGDKTAELCAVACRIGALLSDADETLTDSFAQYGQNLGIAFQIIDDVLDIVGHQERVGKTLGTDLLNQKPTLPVIHGLANMSPADRTQLTTLLTRSTDDLHQVRSLLQESGSILYARQRAEQHASAAIDFAKSLPQSEFAKALTMLAQFVLNRAH